MRYRFMVDLHKSYFDTMMIAWMAQKSKRKSKKGALQPIVQRSLIRFNKTQTFFKKIKNIPGLYSGRNIQKKGLTTKRMMEKDVAFFYSYSPKEKAEVLEIRKKYLPHEESKLEELKRLDGLVQTSGIVESLTAGIGGCLIFGLGLCLAMQVIAGGLVFTALGVLLGVVGMIGMFAAYPVYRRVFHRTKEKHTPRILELAAELSGEKV